MSWELWHQDMFDRETPPSMEGSGERVEAGLELLWRKHLAEGVLEDGNETFSAFSLRGAGLWASVDRFFDPPTMAKLKRWAVEDAAVLRALAGTHAVLLEAKAEKPDAAILAAAKSAPDARDFVKRLTDVMWKAGA